MMEDKRIEYKFLKAFLSTCLQPILDDAFLKCSSGFADQAEQARRHLLDRLNEPIGENEFPQQIRFAEKAQTLNFEVEQAYPTEQRKLYKEKV